MRTTELSVDTRDRRIADITNEVAAFARDAGSDGLLHVFVPHATAGVAVIETGAGTEVDVEQAIERLLGTWQAVVVVDPNRENNTRMVRLSFLPG